MQQSQEAEEIALMNEAKEIEQYEEEVYDMPELDHLSDDDKWSVASRIRDIVNREKLTLEKENTHLKNKDKNAPSEDALKRIEELKRSHSYFLGRSIELREENTLLLERIAELENKQ